MRVASGNACWKRTNQEGKPGSLLSVSSGLIKCFSEAHFSHSAPSEAAFPRCEGVQAKPAEWQALGRRQSSQCCGPWHPSETGTLPSQNLENQLEPHFTLLSFTALSKVPSVPYHHQEKKERKLRWLGSDQRHRRRQGRRKYAALIFNAPFPFSPNKLSATAGRADLFCQQWKYFKYDACQWVTQNPSHKNTHSRSIQGTNLLDLITKPVGFRKSCKQHRISGRTGCGAGSGAGIRPQVCSSWCRALGNMVERANALDVNTLVSRPYLPSPCPFSLAPMASHCQLLQLLSEGFSGHQSLLCP